MKVLFVKLGAIGDAVMALNLVAALQQRHPGSTLTWMCGIGIEPLLRLYPEIDLLVVDEKKLFSGNRLVALAELVRIQGRLLGRHFDLVLHGNTDWRYRLLTLSVRAGETRGWSRHGRSGPIAGRYHGDEYARLAGGEDGIAIPSVSPPRPRVTLAPELQGALAGAGKFVVLAPGGAKNALADDFRRRWPVESYVALARELNQQGRRVALVGGPGDAWVAPAFAGINTINLIGRTNLVDLLAVFARAAAVVSHDTSSAHLPRLVGTPVVALFGPTMPAEKIPAGAPGRVLWGGEHLACRPCYDGRRYGSCRTNECMAVITVSRVLSALGELEADERG